MCWSGEWLIVLLLLLLLLLNDNNQPTKTKFVPLQDLLYSAETFPSLQRLTGVKSLVDRLALVCDVQGTCLSMVVHGGTVYAHVRVRKRKELAGGDVRLFRLNHDKTLDFLNKKVRLILLAA